MKASKQIWAAAGVSSEDGMAGQCRACGEYGEGQPFDTWVKDTFTDNDKLWPGEIVCNACLFCFSDQNAELTARTGKPKMQRMRNYSHFIVDGEWFPLSKGQKAKMHELLLRSPDVAVISDSGQKHIIFRARPDCWQFEEHSITPCPELLTLLTPAIENLYNGGASKGEIESGRYSQYSMMKVGLGAWKDAERSLAPRRGSLPFKLAVYLAQKETDGTATTCN